MKPDISEFSYGYAITENLVTNSPLTLEAAPIFPSLIEEGRQGGGYDVGLPFEGMPLFLQFKLSEYMISSRSKESGSISIPYYRMKLRPTRHSSQHPMLLNLENNGSVVYYVAPKFHTPIELNDAYLSRQVLVRSVFIKPSYIGSLDTRDHCVVFKDKVNPIVCSKPFEIDHPVTFDAFLQDIIYNFQDFGEITADPQAMHSLIDRMVVIIDEAKAQIPIWKSISREDLRGNRSLIEQAAYLSRTFFGCEIYVVRPL